jgi:hypothetical protein
LKTIVDYDLAGDVVIMVYTGDMNNGIVMHREKMLLWWYRPVWAEFGILTDETVV